MSDFEEFPKMARWSREVIITEKIDGTNACVFVMRHLPGDTIIGEPTAFLGDTLIYAGSRTRWITPTDDNYGFAKWVEAHASELSELGEGRHFGEWWGKGIQRNYSMTEKRFSLFNAVRWTDDVRPACCHAVPILYQGPMHPGLMEKYIRQLTEHGSYAAPGFMDPEGVVLFHTAANFGFKKTLKKDEVPKGLRPVATEAA